MIATRLGALASILATSSVLQGCTVHHDDGSLALGWTVGNETSASQCSANSAAQIRISVLDDAGQSAQTVVEACTAFGASVPLPAGDYTASAVLVDGSGAARTTAIPVNPFRIYNDAAFQAAIHFPSSSFLSN